MKINGKELLLCLMKTEGVQNDHQKRGVQGIGNRNDEQFC
jgi:hypothetical protein